MNNPVTEPTIRSLHVVAAMLLAGPQYRESGTIRLIVTPDGFRTRSAPDLAVEGAELVVGGQTRVPLNGTTVSAVAARAGVVPGEAGIYHDSTGASPDEPLDVDPASARAVAVALNVGASALSLFAPDQQPVLWPEHFDVSSLVDDVSYGVSPGDAHIREPYAYVSASPGQADAFWNQPFGAARLLSELGSVEATRDFFEEGRRRLSSAG